jgi:hypothetical protein
MDWHRKQDDLEAIKDWFEDSREARGNEIDLLGLKLAEADAELAMFEEDYTMHRASHNYRDELELMPREEKIERRYQMLRQKKWEIMRQIRDLIRWEREDLEWIWKLERKELETTRRSARIAKKTERANNWKERTVGRNNKTGPEAP